MVDVVEMLPRLCVPQINDAPDAPVGGSLPRDGGHLTAVRMPGHAGHAAADILHQHELFAGDSVPDTQGAIGCHRDDLAPIGRKSGIPG